ncbi:MAG: patatin-like phospholipase family protein [Lachnospiraceae bacterium]|nr:patatin-like phospholipase family protein [Lachnospiraceae bacterium]
MKLQLDPTKEYGIVLEGGGAKGAYQVGAWAALLEAGIKIKGIAGTSVGALNGALMCMDDLREAEKLWDNISWSQVMDIDDTLIEQWKARDFSSLSLHELLAEGKRILKDRGLDITPLKQLIERTIDEDKIFQSDKEFFVSTISLSDRKPLIVNMKEVAEGEMKDMLLASAYLPGFKRERLGGKLYADGGGANNVPVDVLADRGYKDIIVIRIYGLGYDTEKSFVIPEDVSLYHIAPRQNLGGILEFDKKKTRRNRKLGYLDGKRLLYGLAGKRYYIDASGSEAYYFDKMMSEAELLKGYLMRGILQEELEEPFGYRKYTEVIFPRLAQEFGLEKDWDYRDLYVSVLEHLAGKLRISRMRVYSVPELLMKIHHGLNKSKTR